MMLSKIMVIGLLAVLLHACDKNGVFPKSYYQCDFSFADSSNVHPKASTYQNIVDQNRKNGLVGAILLVKDKDGLWIGASGKADIASDVEMQPCNTFLIASISKVFTASAIYKYVDKGILTLEDPISKWLPNTIADKVENVHEAKIKHLLSHTSGIRDYYTDKFELDRKNKVWNAWTQEDVITYIYDKKASFEVGQTYGYSNTNYLLLSLILERASGLSLEQVYQQEVFTPQGLASAYYSESSPIPLGCVKGYDDINRDGRVVDSQYLYGDEIGIGGDGGIAINAYDLAVFLEKLMKGELISETSLSAMTNWFELPADWQWEMYGQTENGFGIEKFNTEYGYAVGHTGGIDGFSTFAFYFPDTDMSYILLVNTTIASETPENEIFKSTLKEMFK